MYIFYIIHHFYFDCHSKSLIGLQFFPSLKPLGTQSCTFVFLYFLLQIKASNIVMNLIGKTFKIPVGKKIIGRIFLESEIAVEERYGTLQHNKVILFSDTTYNY